MRAMCMEIHTHDATHREGTSMESKKIQIKIPEISVSLGSRKTATWSTRGQLP